MKRLVTLLILVLIGFACYATKPHIAFKVTINNSENWTSIDNYDAIEVIGKNLSAYGMTVTKKSDISFLIKNGNVIVAELRKDTDGTWKQFSIFSNKIGIDGVFVGMNTNQITAPLTIRDPANVFFTARVSIDGNKTKNNTVKLIIKETAIIEIRAGFDNVQK